MFEFTRENNKCFREREVYLYPSDRVESGGRGTVGEIRGMAARIKSRSNPLLPDMVELICFHYSWPQYANIR